MTKVYKPIDCSIYDHYELAAIRKQELIITLSSGETFQAVIEKLQTEADGEHMLLSSGEKIRLDFIQSFKVLLK